MNATGRAAWMMPYRNGWTYLLALTLSCVALLAACGTGKPSGLGPWASPAAVQPTIGH